MKLFVSLLGIILQTGQMQIGDHTLTVEIAKTAQEKEQGLMERSSLDEGYGMLFVYEKPNFLTFWMKNTYIPLSIGFFNQNKELIAVDDMNPPKNERSPLPLHRSPEPAQYALEVPQGWFKKNKIKPGTKFSLHDR